LIVTLIICMSVCEHASSEVKVSKNSEEYADYLQKAWEILELLEPWLPLDLGYIKSMDLEFRERYNLGRKNLTISCIEPTHSVFINFHDKEFVSLSMENSEYEKHIVEMSEDVHNKNLMVANEILQFFDDLLRFDIDDVSYRNTTSNLDNVTEYTSWGAMKFYEYTGIRYADCYALVSLYSDGPYVKRFSYMPAKSLPDTQITTTYTEAQDIAKKSLLSLEYFKVDNLDDIVAYEIPELCILDRPLDGLYMNSTANNLVIPDGYIKSDLVSARLYWKVELFKAVEPYLKYVVYVDAQNSIVLTTDVSFLGKLPTYLNDN